MYQPLVELRHDALQGYGSLATCQCFSENRVPTFQPGEDVGGPIATAVVSCWRQRFHRGRQLGRVSETFALYFARMVE
jgi:hypothetical protein